ncbi:MAG: hypothetical protein ACHQRM_12550 [Bacteroidia bacterium]
MKKVFFLFLVMSMCFSPLLQAQEVSVTWSEKQVYENKKDGFFDYFIGSNGSYVYAKFNNMARSPRKANRKIKIVAFDRQTMQKAGDVALIGFKENAKNASKYAGLTYYKTIILEDIIYVFWSKDVKSKQELYVQSFDGKLKPLNAIKKVYELNSDPKSKKKSSIFVMANRKSDERIIIGGELSGNKDDNIRIEYKLLNKDFTFANSGQVSLPLTIMGKSYGLSSDYEFGEDGNLHVQSMVVMNKEDAKGLSKGENRRYPMFSVIDPASGKIKSHSFKFDKKNIFSCNYKVGSKVTKIYGFFCDLDKDPHGYATHGIMYATLNNETFDVDNVNFTYFTKAQLDNLFAADKEDKKRSGLIRSKKKKAKDSEELADDYIIESVQSLDDDNLVLLCDRMHNWSTTVCDGKGHCTTYYYCDKCNVTAFKLAKDGGLTWASNLDRRITYNGWNIYDLRAIHTKDQIYVSYGSGYVPGAKKKNHASKKSKSYMTDRFEYAVFDYSSGKFTKKEYKVNPDHQKKGDKKFIDPVKIHVIDNEFYTNSIKVKPKGWPLIAGCGVGLGAMAMTFAKSSTLQLTGGCLGWVGLGLFISPFVMGDLKHGSGYLGKIEPVK